MINGYMQRSWKMEQRHCLNSIRTSMGYTDLTVRVCFDVLGPLYLIPGPVVYSIHFSNLGYKVEGMP